MGFKLYIRLAFALEGALGLLIVRLKRVQEHVALCSNCGRNRYVGRPCMFRGFNHGW